MADPRANREVEIKLRVADTLVVERIKAAGFHESAARVLEVNQLFDRPDNELRTTDRLLRLRRVGDRAIVTYKGPSERGRHKSREEIEFRVSDGAAFELVLNRLGYSPGFLYEKYRTEFAREGDSGVVTLDETPIGIFLELEGNPDWIDRVAAELGFTHADYSTASYGSLFREYYSNHPEVGTNMTFSRGVLPTPLAKDS
jgi:adenylate cyclase class 2